MSGWWPPTQARPLRSWGPCRPPVGGGVTGDRHGQFKRLFGGQARIDLRPVGADKVGFGESARPTDALGHVFPRQLDMHAAEHGARLLMNAKGRLDFPEDVVEAA